ESAEPLYFFVLTAFPDAKPFHTFAGNALDVLPRDEGRAFKPFAGRDDAAIAICTGCQDRPGAVLRDKDLDDGITIDLADCHRRFAELLGEFGHDRPALAAHRHLKHVGFK